MVRCITFVSLLMLTRDYRECSRYSRASVGTPELKPLNTQLFVSQALA